MEDPRLEQAKKELRGATEERIKCGGDLQVAQKALDSAQNAKEPDLGKVNQAQADVKTAEHALSSAQGRESAAQQQVNSLSSNQSTIGKSAFAAQFDSKQNSFTEQLNKEREQGMEKERTR
jgi:hypothetical protein